MTALGDLYGISGGGEDWMADGVCRTVDPELFFVLKGQTSKVRAAKKICRSCPVMEQCRDWALRVGDRHAILGATTERDRRALRKLRHAGGQAA